MFEGLSKLMFAGLGALNMSRERAEKFIDECVRRGQVAKEHRSNLVQDMIDAAEETRRDMEKLVAEQMARAVAKMNLATREDIDRLERKLDELGG